jgi:hypothetical protein
MKASRTGTVEEAVPQERAQANDADEASVRDPEADGTHEARNVRQEIANVILGTGDHGEDQEDRRLGKRREDRLRLGGSVHAVTQDHWCLLSRRTGALGDWAFLP